MGARVQVIHATTTACLINVRRASELHPEPCPLSPPARWFKLSDAPSTYPKLAASLNDGAATAAGAGPNLPALREPHLSQFRGDPPCPLKSGNSTSSEK